MKFLILLSIVASTAFANTAQFQNDVVELINESIYFGDIDSYSALDFVGTNVDGHETYKLSFTHPIFGDGSFPHEGGDVDEITGFKKTCEYIYYSQTENDFYFTGHDCSVAAAKVLGTKSLFDHSEAEISEVLQTDMSFSFILDYEVPTHVETLKDNVRGTLEIYTMDYINTEHNAVCEYITFDPEINHLEFTGVSCEQSVDEVIEENLRGND